MTDAGAGRGNLITDVSGISVGNAEDARRQTGVTVIVPDAPAIAGVATHGGAPGTRETDLLDPSCFVTRIDAVVLSGGSVFGLDAAGGVAATIAQQRKGLSVGGVSVPIIPAAVLFDLRNGGDKDWGTEPPYRALGAAAVATASDSFALGNAGAGYGARAGRLKGGLGSASWLTRDGFEIGAIAAVNAFGSVLVPNSPHFWAAPLEQNAEFGGRGLPSAALRDLEPEIAKPALPAANTTIAVVATNAVLTKAEAQRLAIMAQDGLARAIRPAHTPFDGDVVFALATGSRPLTQPTDLFRIGALAADCLARAIARGVYAADDLGDTRAYRSLYP
ncbi:MAG TPA: P1 family peptidase [Alphaproteobacteria bacterium]|nr:P1 family peptidase [Alphaproteobacteria bacterium]